MLKYLFKFIILLISVSELRCAELNSTIVLEDGTVTNVDNYLHNLYNNYDFLYTYSLTDIYIVIFFIIGLILIIKSSTFTEWIDFFINLVIRLLLIGSIFWLAYESISFFNLNKNYLPLFLWLSYILIILTIIMIVHHSVFFIKDSKKFLKKLSFRNKLSSNIEYIENYQFNPLLIQNIQKKYEYLTDQEIELVLSGLREFFIISNNCNKKEWIAMPSKVLADAWYQFSLFTEEYKNFSHQAFKCLLEYRPMEKMNSRIFAQESITRAWIKSCEYHDIEYFKPKRLPLIFEIDSLLKIKDGIEYTLDVGNPYKDERYYVFIIIQNCPLVKNSISLNSNASNDFNYGDAMFDNGSFISGDCGGGDCGGGDGGG